MPEPYISLSLRPVKFLRAFFKIYIKMPPVVFVKHIFFDIHLYSSKAVDNIINTCRKHSDIAVDIHIQQVIRRMGRDIRRPCYRDSDTGPDAASQHHSEHKGRQLQAEEETGVGNAVPEGRGKKRVVRRATNINRSGEY